MSYNSSIKDGKFYLNNGKEDVNGSERFCIDPDTGHITVQKRINGIWGPTSFETGPNSLWCGMNVGLAAAGQHLLSETSFGDHHTLVHGHFENGLSVGDTKALFAYGKQTRYIPQSDYSNEWVGTEYSWASAASTSHFFMEMGYWKTGSIAASDIIRIQTWAGPDENGLLIFDQRYPPSDFPANSEVASNKEGFIEIEEGETYYTKISSSEPFSILLNAAGTEPWNAIDMSFIREENILQTKAWEDGATYTQGDYYIGNRKIYVCNVTGAQTGTFEDNSDKWDELGSHLITETDPIFNAWDKSTGIIITESQISDLQSYLITESDPIYSASPASNITDAGSGLIVTVAERTNWNAAYGWGDHSAQGYLTSYNETDPIFSAWDKSDGISIYGSQLKGFDDGKIPFGSGFGGLSFDNLLEWDNVNKRLGVNKINPTSTVDVAGTVKATGMKVNGVNVLTSYTETDPIFTAWDKSTGISITESQISDLSHFNELAGNLSGITQYRVSFGNASGGLTDSPNLTYSDSALRVSNGGIYLDRPGADSFIVFSRNAAQVGQIRGADGSIDITESGGSPVHLSVDVVSGITSMSGVNTPEISNISGLLKIQPDVQGDVELFGDTDVANNENSKILKIWRRAPEGNDYIRFYISQTKNAYIHSSTHLTLQAQNPFTINSVTEDIIFKVGDNAGVKKFYFRDSDANDLITIDSNGQMIIDANLGGSLKVVRGSNNTIKTFLDSTYTDLRFEGSKDYNRIGTWIPKPFQIVTNSIDRIVVSSDGLVGIGKTPETFPLEILSTIPTVVLENSRTIMGTGYYVGGLVFNAGEDTHEDVAQIRVNAAEDWTSTSSPTRMSFYTTPSGSIHAAEAGFIDSKGFWGLGTLDSVDHRLHVREGIKAEGGFVYHDNSTQTTNHCHWNTRTAKYNQTKGLGTWGNGPHAVAWKPDGTKVFIVDNQSEEINEFSVTTPWDVSTLTHIRAMSTTSEESNPMGLCFDPTGTKMYIVGSGGDEVNYYGLTQAWATNTAVAVSIKDLSGNSGTPNGIQFSPDGMKMFIADGSLNEIQLWTLTKPWDVTTASYDSKFDASMNNTEGFNFSHDGRRLYVVDGSAEDDIHQYYMSTPWDISTASLEGSLDLTGIASVPNSITFNTAGTKMYVTDNNVGVDGLLEFDLGISTLGKVAIGADAPAESAALDITSITGALLLPRMTTTQRNALTPANGMLLYDATLNQSMTYENGGWRQV